MDAAGVPHCRWLAAGRYELEDGLEAVCRRVEAALPWPVFVKPANAGSSVGIQPRRRTAKACAAAIATALAEDDKVIFEEFIDGQEVECAAIGNPEDPAQRVCHPPGAEILAGDEFYTYDDKYKNGVSQVVIPAHLSEAKLDEVQRLARKAYLALGCTGLSRCDFLCGARQRPRAVQRAQHDAGLYGHQHVPQADGKRRAELFRPGRPADRTGAAQAEGSLLMDTRPHRCV